MFYGRLRCSSKPYDQNGLMVRIHEIPNVDITRINQTPVITIDSCNVNRSQMGGL